MKANYPRHGTESNNGKVRTVYLLGFLRDGKADYRWSFGGRGVLVSKKEKPDA